MCISTPKTCPSCQEKIGAARYHVLAEGNQQIENIEARNEFGYFTLNSHVKVAEPKTAQHDCDNVRNMGYLNTSLLRILLECSLYLASLCKSDQVRPIVRMREDEPGENDLAQFFYLRIEDTRARLAHYLEISPDECSLLIHYVINVMSTQPPQLANVSVADNKR